MKRALFVWGGWDGHTPKESAELFAPWLRQQGYEVELRDTLAEYDDAAKLKTLDLIVPCWTMGQIAPQQEQNLCDAVKSGVGLAGWHGTMGDSFRGACDYMWMVGGQFVSHPGNLRPSYAVHILDRSHPITEGLTDFSIPNSEQYYMLTDPGNRVLAATRFEDGTVMPAVWTKSWGQGRVAYASFGHTYQDFDVPAARKIMERALLWASR